MKRFVVPPSWPSPPRRSWVPPKTWRPDPSWPPAPEGWRFWVDGKGNPVRGPIGQYAGPSRRGLFAGGAALIVFLGVNLWAVSAIGPRADAASDSGADAAPEQYPDHRAHADARPEADPDDHQHEDPDADSPDQSAVDARGDPPAVLHRSRLGPVVVRPEQMGNAAASLIRG